MASAVDHFIESDPDTAWLRATCNSLKASRWRILAARLFGRHVEGRDMGCRVAGYEWRGKLYLTEFDKPKEAGNLPE